MTATSNNYAEALFMLAVEQNLVKDFCADLKIAKEVFEKEPEYTELLLTPGISKADRLAAIEAAFAGKVCTHILSFLQLLCEKGKIAELSVIFKEFEMLCEALDKTAVATVTSAVELSDAQKQRLVAALTARTGKKITLKTVIDRSVLGGITVTLDGEVIDGSVKANLKHIREVISV